MGEAVVFYIFGTLALVGGLLVVSLRNPVSSAMSLVLTLFSIAVIFLSLHAPFVAVVQILVYAGAIMVLFVFVIMLLNLSDEELGKAKVTPMKFAGVALAGYFVIRMMQVFIESGPRAGAEPVADSFGSAASVGKLLFTKYVFPFEMASILLFTAIIGAIVLAKRDY